MSHEQLTRGERFSPSRFSRIYWVLVSLRLAWAPLIKELLASSPGLRVVDYGCGNMPYRPLWGTAKYVGLDFPSNDMADGFLALDGSLPLADSSADCVFSSQVLEHVICPRSYLQEASRVLVPRGLLLLSTHGVWRYHPDPGDYWRWTSAGLEKTLEDSGFKVIKMIGVVGPVATAIQLFQDATVRFLPRLLRSVFVALCQLAMQFFDSRCDPDTKIQDACIYVVFAQSCRDS